MKQIIRINEQYIFLEDDFVESLYDKVYIGEEVFDEDGVEIPREFEMVLNEFLVEERVPEGMYVVPEVTPKWDGEEWVEVVERPEPVEFIPEPTLDEVNRADIDYMSILLGVEL